jgi:NAD(P)-dependent dehydrogenase (short-subunit alcohol dehydrogenase family)
MSNKLDFSTELLGRRALVSGGTRGMGAAIAQRLLDSGAKVVVTGRSRGDSLPAGAIFVGGDVSSPEGVKTIAAQAIGALGGLDILVNNAGGARPFAAGTASIPDEEWQAAFELNLFAAVRLTNAVLPALLESKFGAIVNISSNAARMPFGPFAHYGAAKAALDMYTRTLSLDLGPKGVRVNVVSPGPVTTPGGEEARRAFSDATGAPADVFAQSVPLGRLGTPDDVAEVVALLASDRGKWMTGANILVDGGMTAR